MSEELPAGPARDLNDFAALTTEQIAVVRETIASFAISELDEDTLASCFEVALGDGESSSRLAKALWSIYRLYVDSADDAEVTLDYVGEWSVQKASLPALRWTIARANLLVLSNLDTLFAAVKSEAISGECERQLQTAKILTDIRPVFGRLVSTPSCFVLLHTLHLTHVSSGVESEVFIGVDEADLASLRTQIDRAIEKARELRQMKLPNQVEILK